MRKRYRVIVRCVSTERFELEAENEEEALAKYNAGECSQEADEVESRDVIEIQEEVA